MTVSHLAKHISNTQNNENALENFSFNYHFVHILNLLPCENNGVVVKRKTSLKREK
jgi:hypothetical protein